MKVYRIIVIVVALLLGASISTLIFFSPTAQVAINDPVTEEYYELLKQNALKVAKTLDKTVLTDETLTADFYFGEDTLVVTVESMKAKLTAKVPISNHSLNVENETIKFQGTAEFKNVEYEEKKQLMPTSFYILFAILGGAFASILVYIILFEAWFSFKKASIK